MNRLMEEYEWAIKPTAIGSVLAALVAINATGIAGAYGASNARDEVSVIQANCAKHMQKYFNLHEYGGPSAKASFVAAGGIIEATQVPAIKNFPAQPTTTYTVSASITGIDVSEALESVQSSNFLNLAKIDLDDVRYCKYEF